MNEADTMIKILAKLERIETAMFGDENRGVEGLVHQVRRTDTLLIGDHKTRGLIFRVDILEWWKAAQIRIAWVLVPVLFGLVIKVLFFPGINLMP